MLSWLFGDRRKKKMKQPEKKASKNKYKPAIGNTKKIKTTAQVELVATDLMPEGQGLSVHREESEQILAKMGGPEAVAAVIKSMISEDKLRRR